jgi:hypothetical protein
MRVGPERLVKAVALAAFSTVVMLSSSAELLAGQRAEGPNFAFPFIKPRELWQVCPPDSDLTRGVVQRYLDGRLRQPVQPEELELAFDIPPLAMGDLEPLTDRHDVESCIRLNVHFRYLLDLGVEVASGFSFESRYHYEITYYRASRQEMYIVAIHAPVVVWNHNPTRTMGYVHPPGPGTSIQLFDSNWQQILRPDVQALINDQRTRDTDTK